jgi:hypothetical protein
VADDVGLPATTLRSLVNDRKDLYLYGETSDERVDTALEDVARSTSQMGILTITTRSRSEVSFATRWKLRFHLTNLDCPDRPNLLITGWLITDLRVTS